MEAFVMFSNEQQIYKLSNNGVTLSWNYILIRDIFNSSISIYESKAICILLILINNVKTKSFNLSKIDFLLIYILLQKIDNSSIILAVIYYKKSFPVISVPE